MLAFVMFCHPAIYLRFELLAQFQNDKFLVTNQIKP